MKKIAALLSLFVLLLSACSTTSPVLEEDLNTDQNENEVIEEQELENKYEATVDYLDVPEVWAAVEVVEANRAYYIDNVPEYWADYEAAEDYPEHMKSYLSIWKTGTFKLTDYEGQSLVLVSQACEGPCSGAYFRYAVDEETDTWTLLSNYSGQTEGWVGGPADQTDTTVEIPELNAPETLNVYENDTVTLTQAFTRLSPFYFDTESSTEGYEELNDIGDDSFPMYYSYSTPGCIYAVYPDGMMARYMTAPNVYAVEANSFEPIAADLAFEGTDGAKFTKSFSLSAGGCGLMWSCIDSFELTKAEQESLEEVGTLGGRTVYLPSSVGERPDPSSDYDLTMRLYNSYDNYLARQTYAEEETDVTMEEYLDMDTIFLIKLDNGAYMLTFDSEYAPVVECGKPVIYLYPERNTLVNVQVGIDEFTKTIPAYGEKGWTVLARANGMLTNLADGLKYPYLFWEGQSYETLNAGETWTLPTSEVLTQLPVALANMGFTAQESKDFMEFWGPLLTEVGTPYVEFAFVNETVMNQIAPLFVRPMPDQVIRVFMYYRGVESAGHEVPNYKPVARHGFTVFEWGGSLY